MPCDTMVKTAKERAAREASKKKLETDLVSGAVTIIRLANGDYSIVGWSATQAARAGWCEGCVIRSIQQSGSWLAKTKLAQAGLTKAPFVAATHRGHSH